MSVALASASMTSPLTLRSPGRLRSEKRREGVLPSRVAQRSKRLCELRGWEFQNSIRDDLPHAFATLPAVAKTGLRARPLQPVGVEMVCQRLLRLFAEGCIPQICGTLGKNFLKILDLLLLRPVGAPCPPGGEAGETACLPAGGGRRRGQRLKHCAIPQEVGKDVPMTGFRAAPATQRLPFQLANPPEERALASLSAGDRVPPSHHPFPVKAEGGAPCMVLQLERVSPL